MCRTRKLISGFCDKRGPASWHFKVRGIFGYDTILDQYIVGLPFMLAGVAFQNLHFNYFD